MHAYKNAWQTKLELIRNNMQTYISEYSYKTCRREKTLESIAYYCQEMPKVFGFVYISFQHNIPPPSLPSLASANSFSLLSCMYIILLLEKCHNCIFEGGIWNLKLTSWLLGPEKTKLAGLLFYYAVFKVVVCVSLNNGNTLTCSQMNMDHT